MSTARLVSAVAVAGLGALALGVAVIGGVGQDTTSASVVALSELVAGTCSVTGPVKGLTAEQAGDADAIVSTTMAAGASRRAARVALMTAITESGLDDVDDDGHDAVGLFEEHPSRAWGTAAQLEYPVYATYAFVTHLRAVPGWQKMAPWLAAQAVQRSGGTGADYEANWATAGRILAGVLANGKSPRTCRKGAARPAGRRSVHGPPIGDVIRAGAPPEHAEVVRPAFRQARRTLSAERRRPSSRDRSGLTVVSRATLVGERVHASTARETQSTGATAVQIVPGRSLHGRTRPK